MIRALRTAATGMYAQELFVDTIANNLANVNTTGFKKSRIEFQDLLYQTLRAPGVAGAAEVPEMQIGYGTRPVAIQKIFSQGNISATSNPLDLTIEGEGFFQIQRPEEGIIAYTRDGSFKMDADGRLITADGFLMEPEVTFPRDTRSVNISNDGKVWAMVYGETEPQEVGQIELARFVNPAGLENIGQNQYEESAASGTPILGTPSSQGFGDVIQGFLEVSNVEVVEEMVNMIVAQRAYEISARAIRVVEDMLSTANNLRR